MANVSFKLFSALLMMLSVGLLLVNLGSAHPQLVASETSPNPGALLDVSPSEVRLAFSPTSTEGGMVPSLSFFWVVRQTGAVVVASGSVDLDDPDRASMVVTLEEALKPGLYTIRWVGVSSEENGFSEGTFQFAIQGEVEVDDD